MEAEGTTMGVASATAQPARPVNFPPDQEGQTPYVVGNKTNEQRNYKPAPNHENEYARKTNPKSPPNPHPVRAALQANASQVKFYSQECQMA